MGTVAEKEKRIKELVEVLNKASEAYYNGADEIMSNYEWDALFDELTELENETGIVLPDSPTQNAGFAENSGEKETHEFPALSLAKTKLVDDLISWASDKAIWLSWKLDGLTLVLTYDDGKLKNTYKRKWNGRYKYYIPEGCDSRYSYDNQLSGAYGSPWRSNDIIYRF